MARTCLAARWWWNGPSPRETDVTEGAATTDTAAVTATDQIEGVAEAPADRLSATNVANAVISHVIAAIDAALVAIALTGTAMEAAADTAVTATETDEAATGQCLFFLSFTNFGWQFL